MDLQQNHSPEQKAGFGSAAVALQGMMLPVCAHTRPKLGPYAKLLRTSFKHLIKSKPSDSQIISSLLRGLQLEQKHPEWSLMVHRVKD